MTPPEQSADDLLERARSGDRAAFDELVAPQLPMIRGLVRRLIAHPEDTHDVTQEALLLAYRKLGSFRGESKLSTWLGSIATRIALDYLRGRKPWRIEAQEISKHESHQDADKQAEVAAVFESAEYSFDAREHIAFCFTCVARTLKPEQQAAVILREVMSYSNAEAATMLGVTESVLRHQLSDARRLLQSRFDGLCALVSKSGACWQCEGLRDYHPEGKRGPPVPALGNSDDPAEQKLVRRLAIVREADVDQGRAQAFHDLVWRRMSSTEERRDFAEAVVAAVRR